MVQEGFLTVREAAARSGLSRDQVTLLLRRGILAGIKIERVWLIEERSLHRYITNRPKPGPKRRK